MDPVVTGSLIGAGGALLGGIFGQSAGAKNRRLAREQMQLQREFAQHGVRWRVEDAKAAGIHPLAALGMQAMPVTPVMAGYDNSIGEALADAGQNVGRAVAAQMTADQRKMQSLGLAVAEKQLEEADARILALKSEAARNLQEANAAQTFPVPDPFWDQFGAAPSARVVPETQIPSGGINPVAPDVIYHTGGDSSTMAGVTPLWRQFTVAPGIQLALPGGVSGDAAEVLESLAESPVLLSAVIAHNKKVNPRAGQWLQDLYGGSSDDPWWRKPGAWLGGKLADLRDRLQEIKREGNPRSWAY